MHTVSGTGERLWTGTWRKRQQPVVRTRPHRTRQTWQCLLKGVELTYEMLRLEYTAGGFGYQVAFSVQTPGQLGADAAL